MSAKQNSFEIRVNDGAMTITANATDLANGDYVCEHQYHPKRFQQAELQSKLDQLKTWLNVTFTYGEPPHEKDSPMTIAHELYKDDKTKDAILGLLEWLEDPKR